MGTQFQAETEKPQRRLAAIMFTDMVAFTALAQRDEALALRLRDDQSRVLRPLFATYGGIEIKTIGDAFLVEFLSTVNAVNCAVAAQNALVERNRNMPVEERVHIRVGIHVGDVVHEKGDVLGDGVNTAARIEPLADSDGICISEDVARQVRGKVDHRFERLPRAKLKGISLPTSIYRVRMPWSRQRTPRVLPALKVGALLLTGFIAGFVSNRYWKPGEPTMHHMRAVNVVAVSLDGKLVASGSTDKTIKVWDVATQQLKLTLLGHTRAVTSVVFRPDGKALISASSDGTVRVWDLRSAKEVQTIKGQRRQLQTVDVSPDGLFLASAGADRTVQLWNLATGLLAKSFQGNEDTVNVVRFSPDGRWIATGGDDKTVRIWDVGSGKQLLVMNGHTDSIWDIAFSPDGRWIASAGDDNVVKLWQAATGADFHTIASDTAVFAVVFSPDSARLASGDSDGNIRLWSVESGSQLELIASPGGAANSLAWSRNGILLAGTEDGSIEEWDRSRPR